MTSQPTYDDFNSRPLTYDKLQPLPNIKTLHGLPKQLGIPKPGLSRAIMTFENNLGVPLFDRNKQEISPTVFGQHILDFGKTLLQDATALKQT